VDRDVRNWRILFIHDDGRLRDALAGMPVAMLAPCLGAHRQLRALEQVGRDFIISFELACSLQKGDYPLLKADTETGYCWVEESSVASQLVSVLCNRRLSRCWLFALTISFV
jgi:hypothetical protein